MGEMIRMSSFAVTCRHVEKGGKLLKPARGFDHITTEPENRKSVVWVPV
jgi:hypothetical protein